MASVDALRNLLGDAEKAREFAVARLQGGNSATTAATCSEFCCSSSGTSSRALLSVVLQAGDTGVCFGASVTETVMRGLWVGFCADEAAMDKIRDDDREAYPYWIDMQKQVETALGVETNEVAARETWKRLCGATHTGIGHLKNHIGDNGQLAPQFTDAETLSLLRATTGLVLSLFILQILLMGREDLAIEVTDFHSAIPSLQSDGVYGPLKRQQTP